MNSDGPDVLFLCTGNATRSVIGGEALRVRRPDLTIQTAGTLTISGLPMSWRTRAAFADVGLSWPAHASRQAEATEVETSRLVIAMAPEHIEWVRREHPRASSRTASLVRLHRDLSGGPGDLASRLQELSLASVVLEQWEEIADPGGGEVDEFVGCARQIVALIDGLADRL